MNTLIISITQLISSIAFLVVCILWARNHKRHSRAIAQLERDLARSEKYCENQLDKQRHELKMVNKACSTYFKNFDLVKLLSIEEKPFTLPVFEEDPEYQLSTIVYEEKQKRIKRLVESDMNPKGNTDGRTEG